MDTELSPILRALDAPVSALAGLVACGSVVYGTAGPDSDRDYAAILAADRPERDLRYGPRINVVVFGRAAFARSVAAHNLFALECLFAPPAHALAPLAAPPPFRLDRARLATSVRERADADWSKAARRYADEPLPAAKRLFHALRVLHFGAQIARSGRITDFTEAAPLWPALRDAAAAGAPFDALAQRYEPLAAALRRELAGRASTA